MRPAVLRTVIRSFPRAVAPPAARPILVRPFSSTLSALKKNKGQNTKTSKQKLRITEDDQAGAADDEGAGEVVIEEVVSKARAKMEKSVHWAKAVLFEGVERGRGRVSPALLDSVRVTIPDTPGTLHLNALASVTTKGNALFVEVWDTASLKQVESAIHAANLPGISPQRMAGTTLKIPIARPTVEQRAEILRQLAETVEAAKTQIRVARTDGFKALGGRKANGTDEVQRVVDEMCKDLDGQLALAKKEFEKP
ncbi:ribosome recycling factor [Cryptococcus neoformans c45]|nr:ribosome recycling factor [Cryptococcus neoformans var. grubii c45]